MNRLEYPTHISITPLPSSISSSFYFTHSSLSVCFFLPFSSTLTFLFIFYFFFTYSSTSYTSTSTYTSSTVVPLQLSPVCSSRSLLISLSCSSSTTVSTSFSITSTSSVAPLQLSPVCAFYSLLLSPRPPCPSSTAQHHLFVSAKSKELSSLPHPLYLLPSSYLSPLPVNLLSHLFSSSSFHAHFALSSVLRSLSCPPPSCNSPPAFLPPRYILFSSVFTSQYFPLFYYYFQLPLFPTRYHTFSFTL